MEALCDLVWEVTGHDPRALLPASVFLPFSLGFVVVVSKDRWSRAELQEFFDQGLVLLVCDDQDSMLGAVLRGGLPLTETLSPSVN
jgi:hypothetical protein